MILIGERRDCRPTRQGPADRSCRAVRRANLRCDSQGDFRSVREQSPAEDRFCCVKSGAARPFPESWGWTVAPPWRVWVGMDDDIGDLSRALCTRAGMIMEDASVDALMMPRAGPDTINAKLERLDDAALEISATINAARALQRSFGNVR